MHIYIGKNFPISMLFTVIYQVTSVYIGEDSVGQIKNILQFNVMVISIITPQGTKPLYNQKN